MIKNKKNRKQKLTKEQISNMSFTEIREYYNLKSVKDCEEEDNPKILTKKVITIIGLICIIGLILYITFFFNIKIPTVFDQSF